MRVAVVIGRLQPFHNEHKRLIDHARQVADKVIILIGSAYEPRSLKNPWTYEERRAMIMSVYPDHDIDFAPLRDYPYDNDAWFRNARNIIESLVEPENDIVIVGCNKDASTFYLEGFPNYDLDLIECDTKLDATIIRQDIWEGFGLRQDLVPAAVFEWITQWYAKDSSVIHKLKQKFVDVNKYRQQWGEGPFICVDSILMSEREWFAVIKHQEGTLALPGGFLDKGERTLDGARRECREEIGFDPGDSPTDFFIADNPSRDERCHNVSMVYVWDVGDDMPQLTAGDDAVEVHWMDFHEIQQRREEFRADHWHLLERAYFNS